MDRISDSGSDDASSNLAGCTNPVVMYIKLSAFIFFILLFIGCNNKSKFDLQEGDLLFSVGKNSSELHKAIQESTSTQKEISYSHVGIVKHEESGVYVIEANAPEGVLKTFLKDFLSRAAQKNNKPLVAVGRLKPAYRYVIPQAIENAEDRIARPYDFAFEEENDAYYCSELVRFSYLDSLGNPIFAPLTMSFKNKETGEIDPYWIKHFMGIETEIPEGKLGTNPADMAKSKIIKIVHTYY